MFNEFNNQAQSAGLLADLQIDGYRSDRAGELTYRQAQDRYGIQGSSTVLKWLRRHGRQDWSGGASSAPMTTSLKSGPARPLKPEQQIKVLQVQLREANEKAQLFEAIVDVLKEDYGVRVVKKPSGKFSRKGASKV